MAKIIHEINVEVAKPNLFQAIVGKQSDYNSRFLKVTFVDGNEVISAAQSQSVTINANRPDGESKRFSGEINEDGTVTVPLSAWMLEIEGTVYCDISVIGKDDSKLTSTSFMVKVEAVACPDSEIADDEHFDVLQDLIADTEKALEGFIPFDGLTVKEYVDAESATHLKKPTTIGGNMIVTIMPNGATSTLSYHAYPAANTVAHRDGKGALRVADPTEDAHAATKKYVDAAMGNPLTLIAIGETAEEVSEISITQDADGNALSIIDEFTVYFKVPAGSATSTVSVFLNGGLTFNVYQAIKTTKRAFRYDARWNGFEWLTQAVVGDTENGQYGANTPISYGRFGSGCTDMVCSEIKLTASDCAMPIGTQYAIYGRKGGSR